MLGYCKATGSTDDPQLLLIVPNSFKYHDVLWTVSCSSIASLSSHRHLGIISFRLYQDNLCAEQQDFG